ncbi:hypothetical protein [Vibrio jasicida]|uniref:hypothetical protein n=1 Tax=Vibrio jasicida TaxID=766224 RepID=UPI000CE2D24C|nr:hypothetical protein [Vibrio jasicida]
MLHFLERWLDLYHVTVRQYFTTYHLDLERVGQLSGSVEHFDGERWRPGSYKGFAEDYRN